MSGPPIERARQDFFLLEPVYFRCHYCGAATTMSPTVNLESKRWWPSCCSADGCLGRWSSYAMHLVGGDAPAELCSLTLQDPL